MEAAIKFTGIVKGEQKTFRKGDKITQKEFDELGLKSKPWLVITDDKPKTE